MAKAAKYKIFNGSTWEELTFTPSSHTHSEYLTSHQSLDNYSTLANTIKSLSISGKTITYTKGDGTTGTLTTQDTNTTYTFTNKAATLAWGTTSTIATVGGTDITVTMPANPNTDTTTYITKLDTRSLNPAPYSSSDYTGKVTWHLKTNSVIGISNESTYSGLLQLSPWNDSSGGSNHQLAFGTNGGIYHRYGTSSYSDWQQLAIQGDEASFTSIHADDVYITGGSLYNDTYQLTLPSKSGTLALLSDIPTGHLTSSNIVKVNGSTQSSATTIYAPTTIGSGGQVLFATGTGAPVWKDENSMIVGTALYANDADTLDGCEASYFAPNDHDHDNTYLKLSGGTVVDPDDETFYTNLTPGYIDICGGQGTGVNISPEEFMFEMFTGDYEFFVHYDRIVYNGHDILTYDEQNNRINGNFYDLTVNGVKATYVDTDQIYLRGYLSTSELYVGDSDEICMDSSGISANEVRAISIYENGTALSNKYQAKGSYLTYHLYRPIKINGTEILSNISSTALNLKAGSNVSITNSGGVVTISASGGGGSSGTVTDYSGIIRESQIYDGSLSAGAYKDVTLFQAEEIPLNEGDVVRLYVYASASYKRQQVGVIEVQMVDDGDGGLIGRGNMFTVRSNYSYQSLLVEAIVDYSGYTDIYFNIHALTASASAARSTLAVYKVEVISNS